MHRVVERYSDGKVIAFGEAASDTALVESLPSLAGADFSGRKLFGADLSGKDLTGAVFSGADCRQVDFRGCTLDGTKFDTTQLLGAQFDGELWYCSGFNVLFHTNGLLMISCIWLTLDEAKAMTPEEIGRVGLADGSSERAANAWAAWKDRIIEHAERS